MTPKPPPDPRLAMRGTASVPVGAAAQRERIAIVCFTCHRKLGAFWDDNQQLLFVHPCALCYSAAHEAGFEQRRLEAAAAGRPKESEGAI